MKIKCPKCKTEFETAQWLSKGGKSRWNGVSSAERSKMAKKGWIKRKGTPKALLGHQGPKPLVGTDAVLGNVGSLSGHQKFKPSPLLASDSPEPVTESKIVYEPEEEARRAKKCK